MTHTPSSTRTHTPTRTRTHTPTRTRTHTPTRTRTHTHTVGKAHTGKAHTGKAHTGKAHTGKAHTGKAHTGRSPLAPALTLTLWAKPTRAQPTGFTLVEAAIIMIVIGIIAAMVIPAITSRIITDRGVQGRADVVSVRDEIIGFAMTKGRLPAESPAGAIRSDPNPALNDLGKLPKAQAGDFWGQQFMYRVARDQGGNALSDSTDALCNAIETGTTNLRVQRGGDITPDIAFIVKSNGLNMRNDVENFTTANPVVVPATGTPVTIGAETRAFDDIVEFVTLDYLEGRITCPSPPPPSPLPPPPFPVTVSFPNYGFPPHITGTGGSGAFAYAQHVNAGIRHVALTHSGVLQVTIRSDAQVTYSAGLQSLGTGAVGMPFRGRLEEDIPLYFIFPAHHTSFAVDLVLFNAANDQATIRAYNVTTLVGSPYTLSGATANPDPVRICVTPPPPGMGSFDRFSITSTNDYTFGVRAVSAPAPPVGTCNITFP